MSFNFNSHQEKMNQALLGKKEDFESSKQGNNVFKVVSPHYETRSHFYARMNTSPVKRRESKRKKIFLIPINHILIRFR